MSFKVLSKNTLINGDGKIIKRRGPKPKGTNLELYNLLSHFYDNSFSKKFPDLTCDNKIDQSNLSFIIEALSVELLTSYTNNIQLNCIKLIHQYVNEFYIKKIIIRLPTKKFKNLPNDEKINYVNSVKAENEKIKIIKTELVQVKADIIENTLNSDVKYHTFINAVKLMLPTLPNNISSYVDYIKIQPLKFINSLIKMNKMLEIKKYKLFQPIPLRKNMGNRFIPFDTSALRDIFNETESGLTNDEIWNKYFKINKKKYKISGYSFNHRITTDGKSVVISFIKNENIIKKETKNKFMECARNKAKKEYANKKIEDIKKLKMEKQKAKIEEQILKMETIKQNNKKKQEEFKKMDKEEQNKIKAEIKKRKKGVMYIEDAVKDPILLKELEEAQKNGNLIVEDPGKRVIGTFYGKGKQSKNKKGCIELKKINDVENGIINKIPTGNVLYSYRTQRRLKETERLKHNKIIDNAKKNTKIGTQNNTIKEEETKLCEFSCKSVESDVFEKYIEQKLKIYSELKEEKTYINKLDQLHWYSYINTERHEDKILNEIEEIYGKDAIFIVGDWSKGDKIKYISTPNNKMIKILAKRFVVYLIDEYRTSKYYHLNNEIESEKMKTEIKYNDENGNKISYKKELHAVLTFKCANKRMDCINRDYNAVKNMMNIVNHLITNKMRPEKFKRGKEKPQNKTIKKTDYTKKCLGKISVSVIQ